MSVQEGWSVSSGPLSERHHVLRHACPGVPWRARLYHLTQTPHSSGPPHALSKSSQYRVPSDMNTEQNVIQRFQLNRILNEGMSSSLPSFMLKRRLNLPQIPSRML